MMARFRRAGLSLSGSALVILATVATPASIALAEASPPEGNRWPSSTGWRGCSAPTWDQPKVPRNDPRRVLIVGDSLTRESRAYLESKARKAGWIPSVRCWGGVTTKWGARQLAATHTAKRLPPTIVVALGTNDHWWAGESVVTGLKDILSEAGTERHIYWVNLAFDRAPGVPDDRKVNARVAKLADRHHNLTIIDFKQAVADARKGRRAVATYDGVHYYKDGYRFRAATIVKGIGKPS